VSKVSNFVDSPMKLSTICG